MTNLRKAAEIALEALDFDASTQPEPMWEKERKALRQALAQPEQEPYDQTALELCEKCGWKAIIPDEGCLVCARDKQKPAAWKYQYLDKYGFWKIGVHLFEPDSIICEVKNIQPLYTAPPKREWVGLADEESQELLVKAAHHKDPEYCTAPEMAVEFGRLASDLLKEKNR